MDLDMDTIMYHTTQYIDEQQGLIPHPADSWANELSFTGYSVQQPVFWPPSAPVYQQPPQQQYFAASTPLSFASSPRDSSIASTSSDWQTRSSIGSTNSSWSTVSSRPYSQSNLRSSVELALPPQPPHIANLVELATEPSSHVARKKPVQRHMTPERDAFATCVSRTRRSRRSQREPRYWCTSCEEPFIEKYDWKRHEETYQERCFMFQCNLCSAIYFLEKDFIHHHETRHNCETCQRDEHLEAAKQKRQTRTGWGCGFCTHFSTDWRERCNHIAHHFEKDGRTMADWHQSNVIQSLLERPVVRVEWHRVLQSQPQLRTDFGWNQHNTGRVEGYPENNANPNLQDLLEHYRQSDDAAALAQLAFRKIAFPAHPPLAPRKDYKDHHTATLQSLMDDTVSWNQFMSTIPEDDISPTNVSNLDFAIADAAFNEDAQVYY